MDRFLSVLVGIEALSIWKLMTSYQYSWLEAAARSEIGRPFVYRALLPWLSQLFYYVFGGDIVFWLGVLFVGSAVGFYLSCRYLADAFGENWFAPFVACQVLFAITFVWIKPYDYATAMFFALSLGLLARGKHRVFLVVFAVASVNRETTFLLTAFYAVYFFGKLPHKKYATFLAAQVVIYLSVKYFVEYIFSSSHGQTVYVHIGEIASAYTEYWYAFIPVLLVFLIDWRKIPVFIRTFIAVAVPVQIVLHLLFGMPFEFRVFAESVSVIMFTIHIT